MAETPIPAPTIEPQTLEFLISKFRCGGYNPQDALNLIGAMLASVLDSGAINVNTSGGGGEQAFSITSYNANNTVAAGASFVEFQLSSDFVGTIDGVAYSGVDWVVVGPYFAAPGKTIDAISFTRSAGTIKVAKLV